MRPDGRYAFIRLAVSLLIATLIGAGMWAVIVVLPPAQLDFGVDRSAASLPYTVMMCALAFSDDRARAGDRPLRHCPALDHLCRRFGS